MRSNRSPWRTSAFNHFVCTPQKFPHNIHGMSIIGISINQTLDYSNRPSIGWMINYRLSLPIASNQSIITFFLYFFQWVSRLDSPFHTWWSHGKYTCMLYIPSLLLQAMMINGGKSLLVRISLNAEHLHWTYTSKHVYDERVAHFTRFLDWNFRSYRS